MSVRILTGDCREMLKTLPDRSIQMACTSPPYYGLRSYGIGTENGEIGLEQSPDAYVAELVAVFREVKRVLADTGCVFLNLGDSYAGGKTGRTDQDSLPTPKGGHRENSGPLTGIQRPVPAGYKPKDLLGIPWAVAFALRADGWWLRSDIIWAKPSPMPESCRDRPTSAHEHVFLLTKRASYFWDAQAIAEPAEYPGDNRALRTDTRKAHDPMCSDNGSRARTGNPTSATRNCRNVWTIATRPEGISHFALMPVDLAERCIRAGTSERGQCGNCGNPWERVTSKGEPDREWQRRSGGDANGEYHGASTKGHAAAGVQDASAVKARILAGMAPTLTLGWQPTCACPAHTPVPQTVLDCFGGPGTTGLVADRLRRNAVLIELNPAYSAMARDRITADCPLFAEAAD